MLDTYLRPKLEPMFNVLAHGLIKSSFTPNRITLCSFVTGILSALSIAQGNTVLALVFLWLSGLLDILDGTVARIQKNMVPLGTYIDLIADRMVDSLFIIGLSILYPQYALAYNLFLCAVLFHFSTFVLAGTLLPNVQNKGMHYEQTMIERAEAFIVFSLLLLFPAYIYELLMCFNVMIFICGMQRFLRVRHYALQQKDS